MAPLGPSVLKFCVQHKDSCLHPTQQGCLFPRGGHGGLPRQSLQTPPCCLRALWALVPQKAAPASWRWDVAQAWRTGTHSWVGRQCYRMSIRFSNCWSPSE